MANLLWPARYPYSQITAVSNSASQREYIMARCRERKLTNVRVVTGTWLSVCFHALSGACTLTSGTGINSGHQQLPPG